MIKVKRISHARFETPDLERQSGYGIVSDYKANAELSDNELVGNARRVGVFAGAEVTNP